jgi:hypothetical protein
MRHLLLAILVALLPLRAWVGDAMAITMLAPSSSHESMVMAPADDAPCADHAIGATNDTTDTADHQHQACDVCNGPAMALGMQFDLLASATHGVLATPTERFDSSVPPPGNKPPIS